MQNKEMRLLIMEWDNCLANTKKYAAGKLGDN